LTHTCRRQKSQSGGSHPRETPLADARPRLSAKPAGSVMTKLRALRSLFPTGRKNFGTLTFLRVFDAIFRETPLPYIGKTPIVRSIMFCFTGLFLAIGREHCPIQPLDEIQVPHLGGQCPEIWTLKIFDFFSQAPQSAQVPASVLRRTVHGTRADFLELGLTTRMPRPSLPNSRHSRHPSTVGTWKIFNFFHHRDLRLGCPARVCPTPATVVIHPPSGLGKFSTFFITGTYDSDAPPESAHVPPDGSPIHRRDLEIFSTFFLDNLFPI